MPRIFISYSRLDQKIAQTIANDLRGIYGNENVWFDEDLMPGEEWREKLLSGIVDCDIFIFLVSPDSLDSEFCKKEFAQAQGARKRIIPLLVRETDFKLVQNEISKDVISLQLLDVSQGFSSVGLKRLRRAIESEMARSTAEVRVVETQETPEIAPDTSGGDHPDLYTPAVYPRKKPRVAAIILAGLLVVVIIIFALVALLVNRSPKGDVKLALEFLVDASDHMRLPLDGKQRYDIVSESIQRIASVPGLASNQVWRGLRLAGGGIDCGQTKLASYGTNLSVEDFVAPLVEHIPVGYNAYQAGIAATFNDLNAPEIKDNTVQVVFIFLGSLDSSPCDEFDLPAAMGVYKQLGINTTLCAFTLLENSVGFDTFRQAMEDNGVSCVHNVSDPEEINQIIVNVVENVISLEKARQKPTETPTGTRTPSPVSTIDLSGFSNSLLTGIPQIPTLFTLPTPFPTIFIPPTLIKIPTVFTIPKIPTPFPTIPKFPTVYFVPTPIKIPVIPTVYVIPTPFRMPVMPPQLPPTPFKIPGT